MRIILLAILFILPVQVFAALVEVDMPKYVEELKAKAAAGDAQAQYRISFAYAVGSGVPQDYAESFKWYMKSAEQGLAKAQYQIGYCYYYGRGVPRDYTKAMKWLMKAAEHRNAEAQLMISVLYAKGDGVTRDYAEASKWLMKSALQGYAQAQYEVGLEYEKGSGVPQDFAEAFKWYKKAAFQGHMDAQVQVGICYFAGEVIPKNSIEGYAWFNLAAFSGHAHVAEYFAALKNEITSEQIAAGQKRSKELLKQIEANKASEAEQDSGANLSKATAIQIAEDAAKAMGIDLGKHNFTGCSYHIDIESGTWFVSYTDKPPILPGGHFTILVNDLTKKTKFMPGM